MSHEDQIAELERLRAELSGRLEGVDSPTFNRRPSSGGWSAAQIMAHVIGAERRSLAYLRKKTQAPDQIPEGGFVEACKSKLLTLFLRSSFKVKAPPGAGFPKKEVDLIKVAKNVGRPSRATCGMNCHFLGGGGDAVKHGDMSSRLEAILKPYVFAIPLMYSLALSAPNIPQSAIDIAYLLKSRGLCDRKPVRSKKPFM